MPRHECDQVSLAWATVAVLQSSSAHHPLMRVGTTETQKAIKQRLGGWTGATNHPSESVCRLLLSILWNRFNPWLLFWNELVFYRIHNRPCDCYQHPLAPAASTLLTYDYVIQDLSTQEGFLRCGQALNAASIPHRPQHVGFSHSPACSDSPGALAPAPQALSHLRACTRYLLPFNNRPNPNPFCFTNSCFPFQCQLKYDFLIP